MSVVMLLPSTGIFLLACFMISCGVLLQPVECMPTPSSIVSGDNSESLSQLTTATVQNRGALLKVLLQMSDAKKFAQKASQKMAGIQCLVGWCPNGIPGPYPPPFPPPFLPDLPFGSNNNRAIKSSNSQSSTSFIQKLGAALKQTMNNEIAADDQLCMCFRSPCPCDQFPAMIARSGSEERGMWKHKRPVMRGKKKRNNKVTNKVQRGEKKVVDKVRHLRSHIQNI